MPYRLVTRSDFDGLICAVLLRELGLVDEILFVHPKDVQDGKVAVTRNDILTNLPYVPEAHLVFDHHSSELLRNGAPKPNHVLSPTAPSAARVVFDHYGGAARFPGVSEELMAAVDQADSAQYSLEDILRPTGWTLLNYLMDSRTGLDAAATTFADTAAIAAALDVLNGMLQHLRYDSTDPAQPARPGWPVGTAQLVDVLRQLALRAPYAGAQGLTGALDLALADRLIPQMSNLTAEQLDSYEEWFTTASLTRTRRALAHLRQAQTTNFS